MAIVQLADVFKRELWSDEFINENDELNAIIANSGMLVQDARLQALVNANDTGASFEIPYIQENAFAEPNIMNDVPTDIIPFDKINKDTMYAMLGQYSKAWQEANIVPTLSSGTDPIGALQSLIARYWATDLQYRIVSTSKGILASDLAGTSDINLDVSATTATATTILLRDAVIDVLSLRGDKSFTAINDTIIMHPKQYADIQKANDIDYLRVSENALEVQTYLGMKVVVDERVPNVPAATNDATYTAIIVKGGAFGYAQKSQAVPVELVREATQGNGGAVTQLIARRGQLIHPNGWSFDKSTVTGISPTFAELEDATAWTRKITAKNTQILFLTTN